jgi:hypothetical protein
MSKDMTWLFASDIHFPHHDQRMVSLWFDVLRYLKPGAVDLPGDIDDAEETSRWVEGTSKEGFSLNYPGIQLTRSFMADIHGIVPRADKHMHDGNHGWYRHVKWLDKNAPYTLTDEVYTADVLYEYSKSGFQWHNYEDQAVHRYGDIYVHHGDSVSKHAGESVRNDVENWGVSLVRGHSHRMGVYNKTFDLTGETRRGYEIGHMCDVAQMKYDRTRNWQAGFAYGLVAATGEVFIDLVPIINYTCIIGTKVFRG